MPAAAVSRLAASYSAIARPLVASGSSLLPLPNPPPLLAPASASASPLAVQSNTSGKALPVSRMEPRKPVLPRPAAEEVGELAPDAVLASEMPDRVCSRGRPRSQPSSEACNGAG